MAWFRCLVGNNGALNTIVVALSSIFAGETITCTNGTKTFTRTCPSSSPYTVQFDDIEIGSWTVSAVVSGITYSDTVQVTGVYNMDLSKMTKSITIYSAANDTVSFTDAEGAKTVTTNSSGAATANITFNLPSQNITFTSAVAKNPSNLLNAYSKTVAVSNSTSSIKVMPDGALYWWGYKNNLETISVANGWTAPSIYGFINPTYETNDVYLNTSVNTEMSGIGSKNAISANTIKYIAKGISARSGAYGNYGYSTSKNPGWNSGNSFDASDMKLYSQAGANNVYCGITGFTLSGTASSRVYALWTE